MFSVLWVGGAVKTLNLNALQNVSTLLEWDLYSLNSIYDAQLWVKNSEAMLLY